MHKNFIGMSKVGLLFSAGLCVGYCICHFLNQVPEFSEEEKGQKDARSTIKESETDVTICLVEEVLDFWFGGDIQHNYKHKWFPSVNSNVQQSVDSEINERFGALLSNALSGGLDIWTENVRGAVALIVLLDQFARHIYRHRGFVGAAREAKLTLTGAKAISVTEKLMAKGNGLKDLPIPFQVFALMPFRHLPTLQRLQKVMEQVDQRILDHQKEGDLLQKFRKMSLRNLQSLEDKAEAGAEILEFFPFKADETDVPQNKLYKAVLQFLNRKFGVMKTSDSLETEAGFAVVVSLSGGVDSMVVTKILIHLRDNCLPNLKVAAIHINYRNRDESDREAEFVEQWCTSNCVTFHNYTINELKRGVTERSTYERLTRDIRYNAYKEVLAQYGCPGVMFGHHIGDIQENVLSNMMKRASLLDLAGMSEASEVNGVMVFRPLLKFNKDSIFDFAHKYGVPYFKDTTPSWSTRGKTRNTLLPVLKDVHGEGCMENLSCLAAESIQLNEMIDSKIFKPFIEQVQYTPLGCWFDCLPYRNESHFFWKESLKRVMHSMGMAQLREKSISVLRKRLETPHQDGWLELRRGFPTYFENGALLIFKAGVIRFLEEEEPWLPNGTEIKTGEETTVGPWKVTVSELEDTLQEEDINDLCSTPPFQSIREFMGGEFMYYLSSHQIYRSALRFQVECMGHIKAFHTVEKKLRSKLSIVVANELDVTDENKNAGEFPQNYCFKVNYKFQA